MDKVLTQIVDFAHEYDRSSLTEAALESARTHLFDTVAVAIAGSRSEQAQIGARVAGRVGCDRPSTVFGFGFSSTPELAAFVNTVMVRTYDWNDGMQARGGGHPSDMIPGLLAIGEIAHSSGADILIAVALAYELLGGMGSDVPIGDLGFDQGTLMSGATALAGGKLLGLSPSQLANAASLAIVPNVPLGVSRWGALSMMKGSATAFAVRSAVFGCLLAEEGMTSTQEPFEGIYGLQHVTGPFTPRLPVLPGGPSVVEMSHQKPVPAETQALALLELIPEIRSFCTANDIDKIEVALPEHAAEHIADPPKYDPQTRETADHSLPYMLAVALVDGALTLDSYRPDRFLDPDLRPLMNRILVHPDPELTKLRDAVYGVTRPAPARIVITTLTGETWARDVDYYKGHHRNPMSRADIDKKFESICQNYVDSDQAEAIRAAWWDVDELEDIGAAIATIAKLPTVRQ